MKISELEAGEQRCDALSPVSIIGGVRFKCQLAKGHDRPMPVEDWAHCATCGGTYCKGIANGSDHRFTPTITGHTRQRHRFWVEWPSDTIAAGVVGHEGQVER